MINQIKQELPFDIRQRLSDNAKIEMMNEMDAGLFEALMASMPESIGIADGEIYERELEEIYG